MMYLAVSEDDIPRAESLVARVGKDYADSSMFAVAEGDSATLGKLLAEARGGASVGEVVSAAWQVGQWLVRPEAAEPFARAAAARPERPVSAGLALGQNLVAQGRWTAADSALRKAVGASPDPWPHVVRGLWAALPFLSVPRTELEAIRADVAGSDPAHQATSNTGPASDLLPQVRIYALALLDARLGDPAAALRGASQLETMQLASDNLPVMRALAAAIRADVALTGHRPAEAVTVLEGARGAVPLDLVELNPFAEDYARFLRGEALLALGKDDEALRWLANGFDGTAAELAFRGPVSLRLGDLYERKGERQKAIDEYARFVRLWSRCDARLGPAVEDARARLARLTAEPRS